MRVPALLALIVALGCEPLGPIPGGRLGGEVVAEPVSDWSFTDSIETVELETRPGDPYSVTTWVVAHEGRLYVPTRDAHERRWVRYVAADPEVRVRVDGRVYERRAVPVNDPAEFEAVGERVVAKYEIERPEDTSGVAFFRLDPR